MNWLVTNLLASMLLPPMSLILLMLLGWSLLYSRYIRSGKGLIISGGFLLYLLSTPIVAENMLHLLEYNPLPAKQLGITSAQAIVVLGGGVMRRQPEFNDDSTGEATLIRLRYASALHRTYGLPILTSGGNPEAGEAESLVMQRELGQYFQTPVTWVENESLNTAQNATYSWHILNAEGIHTILLVTQAWHMPRAKAAFEHAGFKVITAPTEFHQIEHPKLMDFIPRASALSNTSIALHEYIGLVWYKLQSQI